ncbi:hypothetical protein LEMA_P090940.1 [Plenodomus lingam JN3]|uniref:RING-type domain-containing protein n=1 Tax=Leptosphaeria maculans (strain JN3 / isolate v23.1.3 / race Av1-4-5-6-7-8) TaxID=985895 RepID=E5A1W8_LEPMJ|nr:hypothetical protein LEMA_P090940.1 [Plenodomus lingam JN3]CBX97685.1 hypothetical protein LEMA_P090940.1 [Plenodomus lingam JN3]
MANNDEGREGHGLPFSTMVIAILVPSVMVVVVVGLIVLIQAQHFCDWLAGQKEKHPGSVPAVDPLCAICLEEFEAEAQVRGLQCSHAFHSQCLDEWFTRYNEFCPLCHRAIIPGRRAVKKKPRERTVGLPVVMMV